ncbi:MAG: ATP phosphoribosyltransferase [Pseudomonadota bacterium]
MSGAATSRNGAESAPLRFGLPSKGRLQEKTAEFLKAAGVTFERSAVDREYAGRLRGLDGVELVFLQAGEMPDRLMRGEIHLGVTGEDLIRERAGQWERRIMLLAPLHFGHADLIVAAPKCWIDVSTTDDLDDVAADFRERHGHPLRVATKYKRLSRAFFQERGVANYRLVDSQGATEGLVAAGAAEAIVDITSSGETLRANHLKILDDGLILKSQAHLCASFSAEWSDRALQALRALLDRIGDEGAPRGRAALTARLDAAALGRAEPALTRLGVRILRRPLRGFPGEARLDAPGDELGLAVEILTAAGAEAVSAETAADPAAKPSLFERFSERLGAGDL